MMTVTRNFRQRRETPFPGVGLRRDHGSESRKGFRFWHGLFSQSAFFVPSRAFIIGWRKPDLTQRQVPVRDETPAARHRAVAVDD